MLVLSPQVFVTANEGEGKGPVTDAAAVQRRQHLPNVSQSVSDLQRQHTPKPEAHDPEAVPPSLLQSDEL